MRCTLCTAQNHTNVYHIFIWRPTTSLSSKQDSGTRKEYTSLNKERHEYSTKADSDYGYGSTTRFRPIDKDVSGARAIRVQDIPNGAVGRAVEFESMHSKLHLSVIKMRFYHFHFLFQFLTFWMFSWRVPRWQWQFGNFGKWRPCNVIGSSAGCTTICR